MKAEFTGLGSLWFFPYLSKFSCRFGFYTVKYFKNTFLFEKQLIYFPWFLSPPDFTQANSAAQFQTLTAPDSAGSQSVDLKDVLTCNFSTPTAYKLSTIPPYCLELERGATAKDCKSKPCVNYPRDYPVFFWTVLCKITSMLIFHYPLLFA